VRAPSFVATNCPAGSANNFSEAKAKEWRALVQGSR
jgi:hypothetical protein